MGNTDSLPVISQTKSLVQVIGGDAEGALRTQENFSRQCPLISQTRSAVEAAYGDTEAARKTQIEFVKGVSDFVDGVPVVGHTKGVIHYACGDVEGGNRAMKSSSRTTGVIIGGIGGFAVGGPVGAAAGGVAGGAAMDGITTGIDSAVHNEYRPAGSIANVTEIVNDPKNPGKWFDAVTTPAFDALTGYSAAEATMKGAARINYEIEKAPIVDKIGEASFKDTMSATEHMKQHYQAGEVNPNTPQVTTLVRDLETNEAHIGHNKQVRSQLRTSNWQEEGYSSKTQARKASFFEKDTPSALQEAVPDAEPPLKRDPLSCAEQHAYEKYYSSREGAQPENSRAVSVRWDKKTQTYQAVERCENCQQYADAMGNVPTDEIHGTVIPDHPGIGKYPAVALGVGAVTVDAFNQHQDDQSDTESD